MVSVIGALLVAPEAHLTKLRAPEMARFLDRRLLDQLQREVFFERVTNQTWLLSCKDFSPRAK